MRRGGVEYLRRVALRHGDVVYLRLATEPTTLVTHPELVQQVLVADQRAYKKGRALEAARAVLGDGLLTSEGNLHLRRRRLIQPLFHHERIGRYGKTMVDHASRRAAAWRHGQSVDIVHEMMDLTFDIVGDTLLGLDVRDTAETVAAADAALLEAFGTSALAFVPALRNLPLPVTRRLDAAIADLDGVVRELIDRRRNAPDGAERDDLLSLLVHTPDEQGERLGDDAIRDEVLTLLLAGHETTANALSWAWLLLGHYPRVEATLHEEVDTVLGGRPPAPEDLDRLPYTRAVVAESMRLFPPAWGVGRRTLEETRIGDWTVPANELVLVCQYVVHRDPRWFDRPDRFDPDRWVDGRTDGLHRFAYFPFGGGRRACIGEHFAWTEGTLVLATLAQAWQFRPDPEHRPRTLPSITLRPKTGLPGTLVRRA